MSKIDKTIESLFEYLMKSGPYNGFGTDLADTIGASYTEFQLALKRIRSREWIEEHGWTIPFVGQGGGRNPYAVVDSRQSAEDYLKPGTSIRGKDILSALRNWDAQCDHGQILLDGRSAEGRWNKAASAQVKAMIQMAEVLGV